MLESDGHVTSLKSEQSLKWQIEDEVVSPLVSLGDGFRTEPAGKALHHSYRGRAAHGRPSGGSLTGWQMTAGATGEPLGSR
ncbi:hypothetical protein INR49_026116 [Caranx melampygus]|nr:hypothetical protein INR49_026116 [Caranx melampygus]